MPNLLHGPTTWVAPNLFRVCLERDYMTEMAIQKAGGLKELCCPASQSGTNPPWIAMPPEGRPFKKVAGVTVGGGTTPEGTNTQVVQFDVPTGYDGVIVSVVNMFTGTGFVEASGDLNWRIQINRRWLKDYGNIQTTLGSLQSPSYIYRGAVRLFEQQRVTYYVNLGSGALGRLSAGNIVCAFFGWFYPH